MYPSWPRKDVSSGNLIGNVVRPWPFGRPPWLGVTLMKCVIHRQDSYPDNVGHWRSSVALAVLLTRVSARLRKEPTNTFGKSTPRSCQYQSRPEMDTGIGSVPNGCESCFLTSQSTAHKPDSRASQLSRDVWGSSRPLLGIKQESESKRKRLSANKGTREARLSMVVTQLGQMSDWPKRLPMRQSSGGAPVVVRDVNDVHTAKGCRKICEWITEVFFNLEAFK